MFITSWARFVSVGISDMELNMLELLIFQWVRISIGQTEAAKKPEQWLLKYPVDAYLILSNMILFTYSLFSSATLSLGFKVNPLVHVSNSNDDWLLS